MEKLFKIVNIACYSETPMDDPSDGNNILKRITKSPLPPSFDNPQSYNQLNTILEYFSLPTLLPSDTNETKLSKLMEIHGSKYLDQLQIEELQSLLDRMKSINQYKMEESMCDAWEVELANIKLDVSQKYGNKTVEELEDILDSLRKSRDLGAEFEANRDLFKRIENLENKALDTLAYIKEDSFGAYVKKKVLDKLEGRKEDWAGVLSKIIKCNECKVEWLGKELNIDRINLLRIVYNFSARGILEYDRLEDTVSIKQSGI